MAETDGLADLLGALESGGLSSALAVLNARTAHRFTSMYRFDGSMLRNLTFYDRENPTADRRFAPRILVAPWLARVSRRRPAEVTEEQ